MINPTFQIKAQNETETFGQYVIEPLERGYGQTLGNSLRRVLLSSLPGVAITEIKISGIKHKFSTLEGMQEDVVELILNLKQVILKAQTQKSFKLKIDKTGPGIVTAGDIETPGELEVVNKDLVLANLATKKNRLKIEMLAEPGLGYVLADERKSDRLGVIPIDASFGPIRRVNYRVEATRVGRQTNLDRLIIEITSDGSVKPAEALRESAKILVSFFKQIVSPVKVEAEKEAAPQLPTETMKLTVEELDLPTRIANALRKGGYGTVGDLVNGNMAEISKVKNLGEKSIKIVQDALAKKGVTL